MTEDSDKDNTDAGLIEAVMWLTPQEVRVVRQLVDAMRVMSPAQNHSIENIIKSAIATLTEGPFPTHRAPPKK